MINRSWLLPPECVYISEVQHSILPLKLAEQCSQCRIGFSVYVCTEARNWPYIGKELVIIFQNIAVVPINKPLQKRNHYCDVMMRAIASQITSVSIVCSTICSDADQRKHQSSASLAFVRGIHRWQRASNVENVSIWWRHHVLFDWWGQDQIQTSKTGIQFPCFASKILDSFLVSMYSPHFLLGKIKYFTNIDAVTSFRLLVLFFSVPIRLANSLFCKSRGDGNKHMKTNHIKSAMTVWDCQWSSETGRNSGQSPEPTMYWNCNSRIGLYSLNPTYISCDQG